MVNARERAITSADEKEKVLRTAIWFGGAACIRNLKPCWLNYVTALLISEILGML